MKIGTKGHYAVTAMVELSKHNVFGQPIPLSSLAKSQNISVNYLEQLFIKMRKAGLVKSVRGAFGGYLLTQPPCHIYVWDVLIAAGEGMRINRCDSGLKKAHCFGGGSKCLIHDIWAETESRIQNYLGSISLQDILEKQEQKTTKPLNFFEEDPKYSKGESSPLEDKSFRNVSESHGYKKGPSIP
ncbi:Rrf2 family transcriptional regulator [Alphaproteobacteria bacterium]|jgi:Rrf2 family iron-sulfur cluster assembly transcriptional regulator|nr:Rrf2 family transcriptional regulator [Alphaproteobacteria bacterium]